MHYSKNINIKRMNRRMITSWVICLAVGVVVGGLITLGLKQDKVEAATQKIVNETLIYGTDGKTTSVEISNWQNNTDSFKPSEDIPLDKDIQKYIYYLCDAYDINYSLILGMIDTESDFNTNCISDTGDHGLMQINECNFTELGQKLGITDFDDPYQNVFAGMFVVRTLFEKYGSTNQVLMAYNMGESGATSLWKQGIYETNYSKSVLSDQAKYEVSE